MHKTEAQGANAVQLTVALLLGGLLALGVELVVLLLGAAAISKGILQEDIATRITVVSCVLGCLVGGRFTCGRWKVRRLIAGLGTGAVCFLLILAVSMVMGNGAEPGGQGMIELAACLCGGGVAGLFWRKKRKGKRTARRAK